MLLRSTLIAGAAAALLALPAAASADSIVYIQGGDVWSMKPDGSAKVQITTGGNWHSPTQADDGRIAAVQGTGPIRVMAPDGRPLHDIVTAGAPSSNGGTFAAAPVALSFTPDGTRLAYSYVQSPCPVAPWSCATTSRSTFYTENKPGNATPQDVWGNQFGVSDAEWITNDRALVFGGFNQFVDLDDLGGGDYSFTPWVRTGPDRSDGELTRDGTRLAMTSNYGANLTIGFFKVTGDVRTGPPPAQPQLVCAALDPKVADPSWSPDGGRVAFQATSGIEVFDFSKGNFVAPTCGDASSAEIAAGGLSPDWGPADPPAAAWRPPGPTPQPAPTPSPSPGPAAQPKPKPKSQPKATPEGKTRPAANRCTVPALKRGTTLTAAKRKLAKAGCTVKVTRARAKGVRRGRVVRLSAKAGTRTASVTVTVAK